jgi:hypothetical protein
MPLVIAPEKTKNVVEIEYHSVTISCYDKNECIDKIVLVSRQR